MATFGPAWQGAFYVETNVVLVSQSIANNTSTIDVALWFNAPSQSIGALFESDVRVGGTQYGANTTQRTVGSYLGAPNAVIFAEARVTVPHNADGTLSLVINGTSRALNGITFYQTSGGTYTFPTIPRATTPTWSSDWFLPESAKYIDLNGASSSFVHDVRYRFGNASGWIAATAQGRIFWTPPLSLLAEIPNSAYGNGSIDVTTRNGSTVIGTKSVPFYLSGGAAGAKPVISSVDWTDANTTVANRVGGFVQHLSRPRASITAQGIQGATIKSKTLSVGASATPLAEGTTFVPAISGTIPVQAQVTDSRGASRAVAADIEVMPYHHPQIGTAGISVVRCTADGTPSDKGEYLKASIDVFAASVQAVPGTELNGLTIVVTTTDGNSDPVVRNTIDAGVAYNSSFMVAGGDAYEEEQSYIVTVRVSDDLGGDVIMYTQNVPTSGVTLDLNGTNLGIGKYHENGGLDVAGQVFSNGSPIYPIGSVMEWYAASIPTGHIVLEGQAVSRTLYPELFALWGTTFGAGDGSTTFNVMDRRNRVAVGLSTDTDTNAVGKTGGAKTHTLTIAESPEHDHQLSTNSGYRVYGGESGAPAGGSGFGTPLTSIRSGKTGGSQPHNNMQPFIVARFIVRAK